MINQKSRAVSLPSKKKRGSLTALLRQRILDGILRPGQQISTYDQMEREFRVSRATLQHAVWRLKEDGYLVSQSRQGLYVAPSLPCDCRFGFLFERDVKANLYWSRLAAAAREVSDERLNDLRFELFEGLADSQDQEEVWEDLLEQVEARRLGGVVFTYCPCSHRDLLIAEREDLPKVMFTMPRPFPSTAHLSHSAELFVDMAMERFAASGVRRVAFLTMGHYPLEDGFAAAAARYGLQTRPEWQISVQDDFLPMAGRVVKLMLSVAKGERPDGLFIVDDNLAPHVVAALVDMSVRVPQDLFVISHCNLPYREPWGLPFLRLGIDSREVLRTSVEMLQGLRSGKAVSEVALRPRFEDR